MIDLNELVLTLYRIEVVRFGRFELHSGKLSPIYIDLRLLASYPTVLRQVAQAYSELLTHLHCDVIAAIPYAGLPIGTAIALETGLPLIYPRKVAKSYGTGKQIEGKWTIGQTAVIIEDLITSGDSILQGIAMLKTVGLQINDAVVLIDRQQGGSENLANQGYQLHAVLTLPQMLTILEEQGQLSSGQHREIYRQLYNN